MATKEYISFNNLSSFFESLKNLFATKTEMNAKADKAHTHTVANVSGLQSALDGKASSSHGTHVNYSSTAPVMNGTASVGSASTVARSDHRHPIDTSRAAQTDLDALGEIVSGKAASSHTHTISNITNLQATLDNKSAKSHTHTVSNITDLTATVTELNYMDGVTSNVQTQLDGKAASSHNHAASNITSGTLSSDRLPTVPISKGGTGATTAAAVLTNLGITATATELNYVDGVTSSIQTQLNNKSASGHTHNYAGSSSAGGAATSANKLNTNAGDSNTPVYFSNGVPVVCTSLDLNTTGSAAKLTTARSIALGNDLTGSINFDGSTNITISAKHYNISVNSGNKSNYPYHRFAYRGSKASAVTLQYNDTDAIFLIREAYDGGGYGILKVSLRTNASTSVSKVSATWLVRYNFSLDDVKIGLYNVAGSTYADLYIKVGTYARTVVSQLEGNRSWTLVASSEANDTTTSDKLTSTECYASIENAATTLHGQAYTSITSSVDGGTVNYANSAGSVAWSGVTSKPSYYDAKAIKSITRSETTFTYTCMDGTTGTFTQQDNNTDTKVTNTLATTTKAYVTGTTSASTNTGTQVFDTGVYLDTIAGQLTATTFNGTTFKGSGVATLAEVKSYLGI